jgi:hypothetical protein
MIQDYDGKAGLVAGLNAVAIGDTFTLQKEGVVELPRRRASSANKAHYKAVNDRDFYVGVAGRRCRVGATTVVVDLNLEPAYLLDVARRLPLGHRRTPACLSARYPVEPRRGAGQLEHHARPTKRRRSMRSSRTASPSPPTRSSSSPSACSPTAAAGAQDFTIGAANGTHATDFETVAEFVAVHLDGNDTKIYLESDDGTTDVAPTDSTHDLHRGLDLQRARRRLDRHARSDRRAGLHQRRARAGRDGVHAERRRRPAGSFLIAHLEKTATTDTYKVAVDWLRARLVRELIAPAVSSKLVEQPRTSRARPRRKRPAGFSQTFAPRTVAPEPHGTRTPDSSAVCT